MKTIKIQKSHSHPLHLQNQEQIDFLDHDALIEFFPLPRYFQIHFQHMHDNADLLRKEVDQLKQYAASMEAKLDKLLTLLNTTSERTS